MKRLTGWIWPVLLLLAAIVLTEAIPGLTQVEQTIARHERSLLGLTLGLTALGFTVMMGGVLSLLMASGEPMSHDAVEASVRRNRNMAAWPYTWRASAYRVLGTGEGRQGSVEAPLSGIKAAWRSGEWRRDTHWRRLFVTAAGATLLFFGLFGFILVVGPMPVKLLVSGAIGYAVARTVWGFARA